MKIEQLKVLFEEHEIKGLQDAIWSYLTSEEGNDNYTNNSNAFGVAFNFLLILIAESCQPNLNAIFQIWESKGYKGNFVEEKEDK